MKDETTIRFTKEMDAQLMEIAEGTLDDVFGRFDNPDNVPDDTRRSILNALRFAFDAGVDHAKADDDDHAVAFEDSGSVIKAMKAQMSPDTLEAIWYGIEHQNELEDNDDTKRQLDWLMDEIGNAINA